MNDVGEIPKIYTSWWSSFKGKLLGITNCKIHSNTVELVTLRSMFRAVGRKIIVGRPKGVRGLVFLPLPTDNSRRWTV